MTYTGKRFGRNHAGRDLIVGDIHGHYTRLVAALDAIGFDAGRDRLFSVGDLVDRGPESEKALDWLSRPWFHAVRGNHDDLAMRWPDRMTPAGYYLACGGAWNMANPPEVQLLVADAMESLPIAIELETAGGPVGIVHADCPTPDWPGFLAVLADQRLPANVRNAAADGAMWLRSRIENRITSGVGGLRALVVGHTPVDEVVTLGNVIHIDTKGWLDGRFTILDAETLKPATAPGAVAPLTA
jgi:serine/threonine protein phosphatase 1